MFEFNHIGMVVNRFKTESTLVARQLSGWLAENGFLVHMEEGDAEFFKVDCLRSDPESFGKGLDLIVSVGGDGTMLRAGLTALNSGIPLLGINTGRMGFLTATDRESMFDDLDEMLKGDHELHESMVLEASVKNNEGTLLSRSYAINEVAIGKTEMQRMVRLSVSIDGEPLAGYSGDGLIFATSTGSTAYSLAAGGPVVCPTQRCIVMTPICTHSLLNRSMVINDNSVIEIYVASTREHVEISFDGRETHHLSNANSVAVKSSDMNLLLIKKRGYSFYRTLRNKFSLPVE